MADLGSGIYSNGRRGGGGTPSDVSIIHATTSAYSGALFVHCTARSETHGAHLLQYAVQHVHEAHSHKSDMIPHIQKM